MIPGSIVNYLMGQTASPVNVPQIELQPGQIFRGTVLKLFPDNLATVQLGGLTVTARLETALELGQKTWLQVQPGGNPVTLKVISQPGKSAEAADPSIEGLAKAIGSQVSKEGLSLLQRALDEKIPLRPESMRLLQDVIREAGGDKETIDAALLVFKKGLPVTKDTVLSVRAFYGSQNMETGLAKLTETLQQALADPKKDMPLVFRDQLKQLVMQLGGAKAAAERWTSMLSFSAPGPAQDPANYLPDKAQTTLPAQQAGRSEETDEIPDLAKNAADIDIAQQAGGKAKNAVLELFNRLGLQHERQILGGATAVNQADTVRMESVKSALLQVLQSPDVNVLHQGSREQLEHMVQQLTGQQLMLAGDNNSAFMQVAMQLPIPGQKEGENALIQIESRKKAQGELDPDNCRLFFYLSMQNIGETMLDVSIVNKILSVSLYNNQQELPAIVQALRSLLEAKLDEQGYRLSGMRVLPLPSQESAAGKPTAGVPYPASSSSLVNYKGVDLRI
jgi:hypothetical protein